MSIETWIGPGRRADGQNSVVRYLAGAWGESTLCEFLTHPNRLHVALTRVAHAYFSGMRGSPGRAAAFFEIIGVLPAYEHGDWVIITQNLPLYLEIDASCPKIGLRVDVLHALGQYDCYGYEKISFS